VALLGGAFAAGVYTGRVGARAPLKKLLEVDKDTSAPRQRDRPRPSEPQPALTFYQELTAPLTAPPPPPRPAKTSPPPLVAVSPRPGEQVDVLGAATRTPTSGARDPVTNRFTVQIASYRVRPPAEALRESLASAGHDARVVVADANGPVYRVQIGEFATRDAARALADRLAGERSSVAPFVTTR